MTRPHRAFRVASLRATAAALTAAVLLLAATGAHAGSSWPEHITDAEMALLPPYCPDTWGYKYGDAYYNTSPNAPKWVGMMGKGFWAMHHYCWALINMGRVQKPSMPAMEKRALRESALDDLRYVINNTSADFLILPEIYTKMGELLIQMQNPREALEAFDRARKLKPDYWPAYYQWGEYLRRSGRKAEARKVVEEGLASAPQSRGLQRLYKDLGGDPATVKSRTPPDAAAAPEPSAEARASTSASGASSAARAD